MDENDFATGQSHQAVESKAITFILILCIVQKNHEYLQSVRHRNDKLEWLMEHREYLDLNGIDREPVELECNIFPGHTILELLHEIQRKMAENRIRLEEFLEIESSLYLCTTTSIGRKMDI